METLSHLFEQNLAWAKGIQEKDPDFFSRLSKKQAPKYLWIGCSDSRVPASEIVNLPPGEVFVHRNIANIIMDEDLNALSVIQFAVEMLEIRHIIICGHYGCGGIKATLEEKNHGLIDYWLAFIKNAPFFQDKKLENLSYEKKFDLLCELNVMEQVENVCKTTIVQNAWKKRIPLFVHGWIYNLKNGLLKNLTICKNTEP